MLQSRAEHAEVFTNAVIKRYLLHDKVMCSSVLLFKKNDSESISFRKKEVIRNGSTPAEKKQADALRRARQAIYDICNLNMFSYFITVTYDKEKIDREDFKLCFQKVQNWLDNKVKRDNAQYLMIPELHKNKKGIHFHILYNGNIKLVDSGHKSKSGRTIYNCLQWKLGFSTAVKVDNITAVANYVRKYITKDNEKVLPQYYYCSNNILKKPEKVYVNFPYEEFEGNEVLIPNTNFKIKYKDFYEGDIENG